MPDILERSSFPQTKVRPSLLLPVLDTHFPTTLQYIGLQILEKLITTRWKSLPEGQRQGTSLLPAVAHSCTISMRPSGIRNFVVGITVKVASDEATMRREKTYLNKLNLALVQVRLSHSCV